MIKHLNCVRSISWELKEKGHSKIKVYSSPETDDIFLKKKVKEGPQSLIVETFLYLELGVHPTLAAHWMTSLGSSQVTLRVKEGVSSRQVALRSLRNDQ